MSTSAYTFDETVVAFDLENSHARNSYPDGLPTADLDFGQAIIFGDDRVFGFA